MAPPLAAPPAFTSRAATLLHSAIAAPPGQQHQSTPAAPQLSSSPPSPPVNSPPPCLDCQIEPPFVEDGGFMIRVQFFFSFWVGNWDNAGEGKTEEGRNMGYAEIGQV
ncbi:unnamed protein product [Linum trigynum]|uniref:Uncharacterized protein n=1 Tax=Linum trigynum TaxID=586398 RepID=A0AAV2DNM7_9ROSI